MKKKMLRALTISTVLAVLLVTTVLSVSLVQESGGSAAKAKKGGPQSLRATAQQRDVEVLLTDTELNAEHPSIASLNKNAAAVIVGKVTSEQAFFEGEEEIYTAYTVDVKEVLRDASEWPYRATYTPPAPLVSPLKVFRAGGEVSVNGHRAAVRLAGAELLKANKDYVMFLHWNSLSKRYRILGGMSGVFLIQGNNRLKPLGVNEQLQKYEGLDLQSLTSEIRKKM